ncbi:MAG: hypothetical protein LBG95_01835 [Treponema sp.]|jgi:hypothetical protein|nr:hypothetical protein [Treponema sp.]
MKSTKKIWANSLRLLAVTLVALIGFSLTACPTDSGGDDSVPSFLGERLELSGQVSLVKDMWTEGSISYENFTGDLAIRDYYGGSGEIKGGLFSYSIGTPSGYYLKTLDPGSDFFDGYADVTLSDAAVQYMVLESFGIRDNDDYTYLYRQSQTSRKSGDTEITTTENVVYVYVDKDITVNGKGKTYEDRWGFTTTVTTYDFSLELKAGWNAIYNKSVDSDNWRDDKYTRTDTMSLGNPNNLKWVLRGWYEYGG